MQLRVKPLKRTDAGSGLAAIDRKTMTEREVSSGEFVAVDGPAGRVVARPARSKRPTRSRPIAKPTDAHRRPPTRTSACSTTTSSEYSKWFQRSRPANSRPGPGTSKTCPGARKAKHNVARRPKSAGDFRRGARKTAGSMILNGTDPNGRSITVPVRRPRTRRRRRSERRKVLKYRLTILGWTRTGS